jgi:DNA-binding NarL/FixJ family response regulator
MVVEDDAFTRLTLAATLCAAGLDVVSETSNAREALASLSGPVDAAILDLHLGAGPTGLDLAGALRQARPEIGIVLLTSYDDPRLLNNRLPDPPPGSQYVVKKSVTDIDVLLSAIDAACSAERSRHAPTAAGFGALTDVQIETLRLVALGLSNAEIAKRRFVTEKSIELTIARIARALNLSNQPGKNQRVNIATVYFKALGVAADDAR